MTDQEPLLDPPNPAAGPATGPPPPWAAYGADPTGPYGAGWAADGSYLPPPTTDPTRPQPPAGSAHAGPPPGLAGYPPTAGPPPATGYPPGPGQQPGYPPGPGGYPPAEGQPPQPPYPGQPPLGWVPTPWGPRYRGPIGKARPAGTTVLLSIITCGIWTYVWSYQNHDELQRYRGDGLGGPVGLLLAIFVSAAVMFTIPMEIEKMYQEEGLPSPVATTLGLWFLLPIIGNFIWYFEVQDALNGFWVARGAAPA